MLFQPHMAFTAMQEIQSQKIASSGHKDSGQDSETNLVVPYVTCVTLDHFGTFGRPEDWKHTHTF